MGAVFGDILHDWRVRAGYSSLDQAVTEARRRFGRRAFSKSQLHLLEQGKVANPRPDTLQILSELYDRPYTELAALWFKDAYGVDASSVLYTEGFLRRVSEREIALEGPDQSVEGRMRIISIAQHEEIQGQLPRGSEVGVVATRFLDDGIYYPMVSRSIATGIRFYYLLPEVERSSYEAFIARLESDFPRLRGKIDGQRTHFVARPNLDFPMNYVIHTLPSGEIEGFIGLLSDRMVQYFQVADAKLSRRLFNGFRWVLLVAGDVNVRKRLAELEIELATRAKQRGRRLWDE